MFSLLAFTQTNHLTISQNTGARDRLFIVNEERSSFCSLRGAFLQSEEPINFIVLAPNNAFQHVLKVLKIIEIQVFVSRSSVFIL